MRVLFMIYTYIQYIYMYITIILFQTSISCFCSGLLALHFFYIYPSRLKAFLSLQNPLFLYIEQLFSSLSLVSRQSM